MKEKKPKPEKKKRTPKMTPREQQVLAGVLEGKKQVTIAKELGISSSNVSGTLTRLATKTMKASEILDDMGLDLRVGLERYLLPLLEAKETKFFAHEKKGISFDDKGHPYVDLDGYVIEEREVIANDIRLRAADLFFKLHGAFPARGSGEAEDGPTTGVTINLAVLDPKRAQQLLGALDKIEGGEVARQNA